MGTRKGLAPIDDDSALGVWKIDTQKMKQRSQHHMPRRWYGQGQIQVHPAPGPSLDRISQGLGWMTFKGLRRTPPISSLSIILIALHPHH